MKIKNLLYLFGAVVCLAACAPVLRGIGKTCLGELYTSQSVRLLARSQAVAGKTLFFCKGGQGPGIFPVVIPDFPIRDYVPLTIRNMHEYNQKGEIRYDGSCNDNGRKKYADELVPVALTSESFGSVKLCYFDNLKTQIALILPGEECPAGSVAQAQAVDECSRL